jgi:hypothetical protein
MIGAIQGNLHGWILGSAVVGAAGDFPAQEGSLRDVGVRAGGLGTPASWGS